MTNLLAIAALTFLFSACGGKSGNSGNSAPTGPSGSNYPMSDVVLEPEIPTDLKVDHQDMMGGNSSGGGATIVCRSPQTGKIESATLLDIYEMGVRHNLTLKKWPGSYDSIVKAMTMRMAFDFAVQIDFDKNIKYIYDNTVMLPEDVVMEPTDDVLYPIPMLKPSGCDIEMAGYYQNGQLILSEPIYTAMDEVNKAALFVHEALYKMNRKFWGSGYSYPTRVLVGELFSSEGPKSLKESFTKFTWKRMDYVRDLDLPDDFPFPAPDADPEMAPMSFYIPRLVERDGNDILVTKWNMYQLNNPFPEGEEDHFEWGGSVRCQQKFGSFWGPPKTYFYVAWKFGKSVETGFPQQLCPMIYFSFVAENREWKGNPLPKPPYPSIDFSRSVLQDGDVLFSEFRNSRTNTYSDMQIYGIGLPTYFKDDIPNY